MTVEGSVMGLMRRSLIVYLEFIESEHNFLEPFPERYSPLWYQKLDKDAL